MITVLTCLERLKAWGGSGVRLFAKLDKRALNRAFCGVWVAYSLAGTLLERLETLPTHYLSTLPSNPFHETFSSSPSWPLASSEPTTALHECSARSYDVRISDQARRTASALANRAEGCSTCPQNDRHIIRRAQMTPLVRF